MPTTHMDAAAPAPAGEPSSRGGGDDPPLELRHKIGFWLGLGVFAFMLLFVEIDPDQPSITRMAAVATLMAIWWMTEAIPIPATAFLPMVLFPLLGIMSGSEIAPRYMNSNIFLFTGGFLIALAMERWNLHRRIALSILRMIGGQPHRLVLGFMLATAFLSMWISNTATTMMMLPMALSLVLLYEGLNAERRERGEAIEARASNFPIALMLAIAYSASIGGFATIIGTPPNVVFVSLFEQEFPAAPAISFAQWGFFAFPMSIVFLFLAWILLTRALFPLPASSPFSGKEFVRDEVRKLGPVTREEIQVFCIFITAAALWITRREIAIEGFVTIPGWSSFLGSGSMIDDGTVAMTMGMLLFLLPARKEVGGGRLMNWRTAKGVPWGILILFGGGFALAAGFTSSGLSDWIGGKFGALESMAPWAVVMSVAVAITGLTELTSNTATTTMIMPILASLARTIEVHPLLLMIPAALAASCAFMLPVATPPNAIIYGSEKVPIGKMIYAGIFLNILGVILIMIFILTAGLPIFDISTTEFPDWAR